MNTIFIITFLQGYHSTLLVDNICKELCWNHQFKLCNQHLHLAPLMLALLLVLLTWKYIYIQTIRFSVCIQMGCHTFFETFFLSQNEKGSGDDSFMHKSYQNHIHKLLDDVFWAKMIFIELFSDVS